MFSKKLTLIPLVLCLIWSIHDCIASERLLISETFQSTYVGTYSWLYEDTTSQQTIYDIYNQSSLDWEKQEMPKIINGISGSNYWVKFELNNTSGHTKDMTLVLENAVFDRIQFFIVDNNEVIDSSNYMGDLLPFKEREVHHRYYVYNFQIPANSNWQIYTMAGKMGGKFVCPLKLYTAKQWSISANRLDLYHGLTTGFHVMLFIFCLLLAFIIKRRYVFYFMMQITATYLFFLATSGLGFQYLWPNAIYFQQSVSVIPNILLLLFKVLFVINFFSHLQKIPAARRILKLIIILQTISFILPVAGFLFDDVLLTLSDVIPSFQRIYITLSGIIAHLFNLIGTILGVFVFIRYFNRINDKPFRIYSVISILELVGILFAYFLYFTTINITAFNIVDFIIYMHIIEGVAIIYFIMMEYKNTLSDNEQLAYTLSKKQNEALQNLLVGQEKERKRLSQEIHDGLSIRVSQLKHRLSSLKEGSAENIRKEVPALIANVDHLHQDLRNFSHALNPIVLQKFGLVKAINEIIHSVELNNEDLDIQFNYSKEINLKKEQEKHFYSIIQELLNNTLKYAGATEVVINLKRLQESFQLAYTDNGKGITQNNIDESGIGLRNIQSRVYLMRGKYTRNNLQPQGLEHSIFVKLNHAHKQT